MTLDELQVGKDAVIQSVGGEGALRRHFLDMGLIPGTEVTLMKVAPMGDPIEYRIWGYELTLMQQELRYRIYMTVIMLRDSISMRRIFHIRR